MEWVDSLLESFGWVHFWIVLGIALGIIEVVTLGFLALPFALGAFIAAFSAWLAVPEAGQFIIFAISSIFMLFLIRFLVKKYFTSEESETIKTNFEAMVGKEALVTEPIEGSLRIGAVKIGGEIWSAVTNDSQIIEKDEAVIIEKVEGSKLKVVPRGE